MEKIYFYRRINNILTDSIFPKIWSMFPLPSPMLAVGIYKEKEKLVIATLKQQTHGRQVNQIRTNINLHFFYLVALIKR